MKTMFYLFRLEKWIYPVKQKEQRWSADKTSKKKRKWWTCIRKEKKS